MYQPAVAITLSIPFKIPLYATYKGDILSVLWCFNIHVILCYFGKKWLLPTHQKQVVFSSSLSSCGHGVDVGKCTDSHWPHGGVVQPMGQHDIDAKSCKKCNTILTRLIHPKVVWKISIYIYICFFRAIWYVCSRESNQSNRWDHFVESSTALESPSKSLHG